MYGLQYFFFFQRERSVTGKNKSEQEKRQKICEKNSEREIVKETNKKFGKNTKKRM